MVKRQQIGYWHQTYLYRFKPHYYQWSRAINCYLPARIRGLANLSECTEMLYSQFLHYCRTPCAK